MQKLTFIGILLIIISACEREYVNPAEETFLFYENATLTSEAPFASDGNQIVFHHYYKAEDEENIADDEYSEELFFELEDKEEFQLKGEALKSIDLIFKQYCYCPEYSNLQVVDGYLNGSRKGADKYLIEANVEMIGYYLYEGDTLDSQVIHSAFTGYFKKSSKPTGKLN